jgi:hypothetical protein
MKNRIQGINLNILRLISDFNLSLKKYLLLGYTENMLNGEIGNISVDISVNNNTNFKKNLDSFYLHYKGWIRPKSHLTLLSL